MYFSQLFFFSVTLTVIANVRAVSYKPTTFKPVNDQQLKEAISSAKPGDKILLQAQPYAGSFTLPLKHNPGPITIDGKNGRFSPKYAEITNGIKPLKIEGNQWVLQNVKISASQKYPDTLGVYISGDKNTLNNVWITGNSDGISVQGHLNKLQSININAKKKDSVGIIVLGNGNVGGPLSVVGAKIGMKIRGERNVFNKLKVQNTDVPVDNTNPQNKVNGITNLSNKGGKAKTVGVDKKGSSAKAKPELKRSPSSGSVKK